MKGNRQTTKEDKKVNKRRDFTEVQSRKPGANKRMKKNDGVAVSAAERKSIVANRGKNLAVPNGAMMEAGESFANNEAVLAQVFLLYPPSYQDLVNIRLVNKTWRNSSLERWRSTAILTLIPENNVFRNFGKGVTVTDFLGCLEDDQNRLQLKLKPYSRFTFQELKMDMSVSHKGLARKFWRLVGHNIRYLHLNGCEFLQEFEKPLQSLLLVKTPNLEEIVVTDSGTVGLFNGQKPKSVVLRNSHNLNVKKVTVHRKIPLGLDQFLKMFPNIKEVTIRNSLSYTYSSSLLEILQGLSPNPRSKKYTLEKLDIMGTSITNKHTVRAFMGRGSDEWNQLGFNLQTLCLELKPLDGATTIFQSLLQCNKNVKTLALCVVPQSYISVYPPYQFQLKTHMEALTSLQLWGGVIQNFKFLKFMPNLRHLYMNPLCFEKWPGKGKHFQLFENDLVTDSRLGVRFRMNFMEQLHVEHELSSNNIQKLSKWMPNLKVLKTILNVNTFPVVCQKWTNLMELGLHFGSRVKNETIIGVKSAPAAKPKLGKKQSSKRNNVGILNFKNLNVFTLETYCDEAELSDACVHEAFLKMPGLVTLKTCVSERMSTEAEDLLKRNIPCVRVIRNNGLHDQSECCIRKVFLTRCNASREEEERFQEEEDMVDAISDSDSSSSVDSTFYSDNSGSSNSSSSSSSSGSDNDDEDDFDGLEPMFAPLFFHRR